MACAGQGYTGVEREAGSTVIRAQPGHHFVQVTHGSNRFTSLSRSGTIWVINQDTPRRKDGP